MADSPENDAEKPATAADGQQKEESGPSTPVEFGPPAFMQKLFRRYQERYGAQHKQWCNEYIVRPTILAWRYLYARWTRRVQLAALAVGIAIFAWLWISGRMDSNTVIAVFTVVLTYATWYGWQAMRTQNRIMRRQMKQTEAIIEQMRLENRAWLGAVSARIKTLQKGYNNVVCRVRIKNTGKTPGRIISVYIRHYVRPDGYDDDLLIHEFEREPDPQRRVYAAHPNETIKMDTDVLGTISDEVIEEIRTGIQHLHIFVRFRYRDISGEQHEDKAWFTAIAAGPQMRRQANYCGVF